MVSERDYEVGIVKEVCQTPMWMKLVNKPMGRRLSLLHEAEAGRISLVMP